MAGCVTLPILGNRSLKKTSSSATMALVVSTTTSSVKVSGRLHRWVEHRPYFMSLILSLSTSCYHDSHLVFPHKGKLEEARGLRQQEHNTEWQFRALLSFWKLDRKLKRVADTIR